MNEPHEGSHARRFERLARLVGRLGLRRLEQSRVMMIGLGGVGSFAAEALARCGIGHLMLVDFDRVCITNSNRQLQATQHTFGQLKADALAERLRAINPEGRFEALPLRFCSENASQLLACQPTALVDAIDDITTKAELLTECRGRSLFVVTSLGAAARVDPSQVHTADLTGTRQCPMGRKLRKLLRQKHGFPRSGPFGIPAVYSMEPPRSCSTELPDDAAGLQSTLAEDPAAADGSGQQRTPLGSACFMTGTFGLFCASLVARRILADIR